MLEEGHQRVVQWLEDAGLLDYLSKLWDSRSVKTICVGVACGLGAYLLLRKGARQPRLPPGPKPWPVVGNLFQLGTVEIHKVCYELSKKYGPAITIRMGPAPCIILNRIDVVLEALVRKQADFAGRLTQMYSANVLSQFGQDIVMAEYGPDWKLRRKIATKALRHYLTGRSLEEKVWSAVTMVIDLLKKEEGPFDPHSYVFLITANILCSVCFGKRYDKEDPEFKYLLDIFAVLMESISEGLILEDVVPLLRYWPTKKFRRIVKLSRDLNNFIAKQIEQHRKTFDRGHTRDFTDSVLLAQKEVEEEGQDTGSLRNLTDQNIVLIVANIFSAGNDTSRLTLYWALLYIAANPRAQDKIHKELDTVLGKGRLPSLADRAQLPYTEASLFECMRLSSTICMGVPHTTTCDTSIGEYEIPKGTPIMINHWALHHDPDQWEEPLQFRPERFLDASGKMAPKPESFLPFSAGRRVCLGESVVKPELHLILAAILQTFRIALPSGVDPDFEPLNGGVVRIPRNYKLCFTQRKTL